MKFDALWQGLFALMNATSAGYVFLGVFIGIVVGIIPGISSVVAIVLILPFIWGGDAVNGAVILLSVVGAVHCANTFPAIYFNVPGSPSASATILDGYPLARKGEAMRALTAAFIVSALGGIIGALMLALSVPIMRPLVLQFASPEVFMLIMMGIIMIGIMSGSSPVKGVLSGAIGLMASMVGMDPQAGIPRYAFGLPYLRYGLSLIPILMGLFALPQVVDLALRGRIAEVSPKGRTRDLAGFKQGFKDALTHWAIVLQSAIIGVIGGAIPGLGGTAAAFYAYAYSVRGAKDKTTFGQGDIRGVIAPESANNASQGGELIPTLAFGVPGSPVAAILMAAFLVLGIIPGPEMLTTRLPLTFSLVWCLIISNILAASICLALAAKSTWIAWIRGNLLIPFILLFVLVGSYAEHVTVADLYSALVFGILGLLMMEFKWPRVPLLIGFVLGGRAENSFYISAATHGPFFFMRPIAFIILLIIILTIMLSFRGKKATHAD